MIDARIPDPKLLVERLHIITGMPSCERAIKTWRSCLITAELYPKECSAKMIAQWRRLLSIEEEVARRGAERLRQIETETGVAGSA